jgi:hypothetical protein
VTTARTGLPSAPKRLARRRLSLAAVAAVAALAIIATQIEQAASVRLTAEIDSHWRGAYDILVRPHDSALGLDQTRGLVEPDFVALTGRGGISVAQWQAIRALPDVEIAAPIGWVGLMNTPTTAPSIEVTSFPRIPTVYEVTVSVTTFDGAQHHLVFAQTQHVLLGAKDPSKDQALALSDGGDVLLGPLPNGSPVADIATAQAPPQVQSPILAIDPDSEMALLGPSGVFLGPLAHLGDRDTLTTLSADPNMVPRGYNARLDIAILKRQHVSRPVIPVLVSSKTYAPLQVTIDVVQIGKPIDGPINTASAATAIEDALKAAGDGRTVLGTSSVDAASSMRAFRLNSIAVPWPGTTLSGSGAGVRIEGTSAFQAGITGRPTYTDITPLPGSGAPSFMVVPRGQVPPGGPGTSPSQADSGKVGSEQSYRSVTELEIPLTKGFVGAGTGDQPFIFAPIAEYDLSTVQLPRDPLAYVPFGAYDQPDTALVAGPNGVADTPTPMSPTLNPAGLIGVPPMGIVDIHAAEQLRGPAPIDAIRIRVAGISDYGPAALARVDRVAATIIGMGLDATVVAASSPQTVNVYVPAYDTSVSPPRDLGWVAQHWTTVGAAPRVDRALGETNLALLVLALLGVSVLIIGSLFLQAAVRAREAAILAAIGWTRSRIVGWQAAESVWAGVVVGVASIGAWAVSSHELLGLVVPATGSLLFIGGGLVAAALVKPSGVGSTASDLRLPGPRKRGSSTIPTYAARSLALRPWRSVVTVAGLSLTAATLAPAVALVLTLAVRAGPTLLATALLGRLAGYQIGLIVIVVMGALTFTLVALRIDYDAQRAERRVLEATGWRPSDIRRLLAWKRAIIALPAAPISGIGAYLLAVPIMGDGVAALPVAIGAATLAVSSIAWGALAYRGSRP